MKKIVTLLFGSMACCSLQAQVSMWDELSNEAVADTIEMLPIDSLTESQEIGLIIPESLDANVDSLLKSWHVRYYTKKWDNCNDDVNVKVTPAVYVDRLSRLPNVIELSYNEEVRKCIELYTERRRVLVSYMLGLADFYFPMIEKALDENGLPLELKYLAIVESALNPTAVSRAGATGLWQFMLPTGKMHDLEINSLVDERRDPVKATYAACRYFKDMYASYGDWNLVIAAYNCGPGTVNKAIRKAGGKTDYWSIYNYLPKETRTYVPLFIAANYVMNYFCEHNICPVLTELPLSTDTVMITNRMHFDQLSEVLQIDKEQLKALNPQYKRDIVPGNSRPYPILLPTPYAFAFVEKEDSIYAHRSEELFANRLYTVPGKGGVETKLTVADTQEKVVHQVKAGETLSSIASQYGVTMSNVKKWNNLRSNRVSTGARLTIYADNGGYAIVTPSQTKTTVASSPSTSKNNTTTKNVETGGYKRYKVRSGDSFYTISKKYPGYSAKDLMEINKVKSSSLKVGQWINVPAV